LSTNKSRIRKGPAFCVSGTECENPGKLAAQLDLQLAILRHQADHLDQTADQIKGLVLGGRVFQKLAEVRDLVAVDLSQVRMKQWLDVDRLLEIGLELLLARLQTLQVSHQRAGSVIAAGQQVEDATDALVGAGQLPLDRPSRGAPADPTAIDFRVKLLGESLEELGIHQTLFNRR
jgi:hypothetical protein